MPQVGDEQFLAKGVPGRQTHYKYLFMNHYSITGETLTPNFTDLDIVIYPKI